MSTWFALKENQNNVERLHTTFQMVNVGMLDNYVSLQLLIYSKIATYTLEGSYSHALSDH